MKIIQQNKKAVFDYEILEEFVAGLVLTGPEIKSVRAGHVNLKGAYVSVMNGEARLKNANIARYSYDSSKEHDPFRERKLLLKESELQKIAQRLDSKGYTLVPLAIGLLGRYAKLKIGLARGRKKEDKRTVIREREDRRQIARAVRNFGR